MNSQAMNQTDADIKCRVGPPSAAGDNDSVDSESVGSGDDPANEDAEGVWSPDIEQSFQEALLIYPPCGRRKIILSDEGKMYGRNELIARYIRLRTGKSRTRKQVSSHIQVLARRKSKEIQSALKDAQQKERAIQTLNQLSSAQIVSATLMVGNGGSQQAQQAATSAPAPANSKSVALGVAAGGGGVAPTNNNANGGSTNVLEVLQALNNVQNATGMGSLGQTNAGAALVRPMARPAGGASQLHASSGQYGAAMLSAISPLYTGGSPQAAASGAFTDGGLLMPTSLPLGPGGASGMVLGQNGAPTSAIGSVWPKRAIAGPLLKLVEFTAFAERRGVEPGETDSDENALAAQRGAAGRGAAAYGRHVYVHVGADAQCADEQQEAIDIRQIADKFPDKRGGLRELFDLGPMGAFYLVKFWADLNVSVDETLAAQLVTTVYESPQPLTIKCSTKVCSFGRQVVEKIETESGQLENGRYVYRLTNVAMCDYMTNFLARMRQLPEPAMMNKVLENFTILNVVTNADTKQTLLCLAFVFEVSTSEHGAQCNVYRLVRDA